MKKFLILMAFILGGLIFAEEYEKEERYDNLYLELTQPTTLYFSINTSSNVVVEKFIEVKSSETVKLYIIFYGKRILYIK